MNETRRDALVEWVTDILGARSQLTATELSHRDIYQDANELVDAAIAAFEQALLQPEVVDKVSDVIAGEFYADLPMMSGDAYGQVAKAALQAALAAAKGTEGSA